MFCCCPVDTLLGQNVPGQGVLGQDQLVDKTGIEFFERRIRPVLVQHCFQCHSSTAKEVKGGLMLDSREAVRSGGDSGAAVVPGHVESSLLLQALRYDELEMPPSGKLPRDVISDFETWIAMGAPDPRDDQTYVEKPESIDFQRARNFWSFQSPGVQQLPQIQDKNWSRRRIDNFILRRLKESALTPSAAATRRTLIRRVNLDLTGLPPTFDEVEAFLGDPAPDAYERLVDRLLDSPQYGERWARMWLDVARYAEDQAHIVGDNKSLFYPNAYLYRNWVIEAFNADMAYNRFVQLQLAADLVEPDLPEHYVALGFIGLGPKYYNRSRLEVMADEWEDRVDTVSRGLLGLTVACARCHDHKYDPISTEDYYGLAGVFASTEMFNRPLGEKAEKDEKGQSKSPDASMHVVRESDPTDLNVFIRGDINRKGPSVRRRFIRVLSRGEPQPFTEGSGRAELARQIASRDNPLTARVLVNRVWARLFGRPLVATPSNFGALGQPPTHPELLDDLATGFMDSGWSLKWLHRQLVLSASYQQSSDFRPDMHALDPANQHYWRFNRRRLDVEAWRDTILAVCDRLDTSIGGPSFEIQDPTKRRRSLYSQVSRFQLAPMLALFDFPDPNAHSANRARTTTPLQKLFVLNSPFMVEHAKAFAERIAKLAASQSDLPAIVQAGHQLGFGRPATQDEVRLARAFIQQHADRDAGLHEFAHALLASNELLFID